MYPSHWDPEVFIANGRNTARLAMSGFALINDYEQEQEGTVSFTGHSVLTYDFSKPGQWIDKMEMSRDGGSWNTMFDAVSTRD